MNAFRNVTTVIAGTAVATALTSLNQLLNGTPSFRTIIGGFVVGTGLLVLAMFSTPVAAALALLILITSLLVNAAPILQKVMP